MNTIIITMTYKVPVDKLQKFLVAVSPFGDIVHINHRVHSGEVSYDNRMKRLNLIWDRVLIDKEYHIGVLYRKLRRTQPKYPLRYKTFQRDIAELAVRGYITAVKLGGGAGGNTTIIKKIKNGEFKPLH